MNTRYLLSVFIGCSLLLGCSKNPQQKATKNYCIFPKEATIEQKVKMAANVAPSARQLEWQQMEFTAQAIISGGYA